MKKFSIAVALVIVGMAAFTLFYAEPALSVEEIHVYTNARQILGNDFISPEEISKVRKLSYSSKQLKHFVQTLPSQKVLQWLKENNYALMAGPPKSIGLLGVRSLAPELFYMHLSYEDQFFSRNDTVKPEWLAIRKKPVPNSTNKNREKQLILLSKDEKVPNAGEISWFITTFYVVRGVRLFQSTYVRASSADSYGYRVVIGHNVQRLHVYRGSIDDGNGYDLGIASARKFPVTQ